MRTQTKENILKLLDKRDYTVTELADKFNLSNQMIHRHLKDLLILGEIGKKGKMPRVFYFRKRIAETKILESKDFFENKLLPKFLKQNKAKTFKGLSFNENNNKQNFDFLLTASALYSSNIEGNTLDLNSFINKDVLSKNKKKEIVEIEDLKSAYAWAMTYGLSEKRMLEVHKILAKSLVSKNRCGKYRQEAVGVFGSGGLAYLAVESEFVTSEMNLFFENIQKLLEQKMNKQEVFFWALWIHLTLALVHPFSDGNGRMARILEKWFLVEKLGKKYWYLQTEKYYWDNLQKYYQNLSLGPNYWEVDWRKAKSLLN
jgi:Fic family protein